MAVSGSIYELPSHIVFDILTSGRLSAIDLVCLELSCSIFGGCQGLCPLKFRSLVDMATAQLRDLNPIYKPMSVDAKKELFDRCGGNWKRVLRFLQSVQQASDIIDTSLGNYMQISQEDSTHCLSAIHLFTLVGPVCAVFLVMGLRLLSAGPLAGLHFLLYLLSSKFQRHTIMQLLLLSLERNKRPEFTSWLLEVKQVNLESLPNRDEKIMFKEYMEDYNTATFPYKKQEMMQVREKQKEQEIIALKDAMKKDGMAPAMKEQARLKEEMVYLFKIGNTEAAAAIQRKLDPDVAM